MTDQRSQGALSLPIVETYQRQVQILRASLAAQVATGILANDDDPPSNSEVAQCSVEVVDEILRLCEVRRDEPES